MSPRYLRYFDRQGNPLTLDEWAGLYETADRLVGLDAIGQARISTVWLGVDHQFGDGPPLIFETMIFGGPYDERQWRYSTEAEAIAGHHAVVNALRNETDLPQ